MPLRKSRSKHLVALKSDLRTYNAKMGRPGQQEKLEKAFSTLERVMATGDRRAKQAALNQLCRAVVETLDVSGLYQ